MITAIIDAGQHYCQAVSDLWQWDYGQTLRIQGVKLPAAVEVQFSTTERIGETVTRIGVTQELSLIHISEPTRLRWMVRGRKYPLTR